MSAVINKNHEELGMLKTPLIGPQNWGDSAVIQASGSAADAWLFTTRDAQERIRAFREKRKPKFTG